MQAKTDLYIVFKLPTRGRPASFKRAVDSLTANLINDFDYKILVSADEEDEKMYCPEMKDVLLSYGQKKVKINMFCKESKGKVDAYNRDLAQLPYWWDIIVCISDQIEFTRWGIDDLIRSCFANKDGFYGDQIVFIGDDYEKQIFAMGRDYYRRFKYIYHPEYHDTYYAKRELQSVANILGNRVDFNYKLFNKYEENDAVNIYSQSFHEYDERIFKLHKAMNFNL